MDAPVTILLLETGFDHCRVILDQQGGLIAALFMAGFAGSLGHCAAMWPEVTKCPDLTHKKTCVDGRCGARGIFGD